MGLPRMQWCNVCVDLHQKMRYAQVWGVGRQVLCEQGHRVESSTLEKKQEEYYSALKQWPVAKQNMVDKIRQLLKATAVSIARVERLDSGIWHMIWNGWSDRK